MGRKRREVGDVNVTLDLHGHLGFRDIIARGDLPGEYGDHSRPTVTIAVENSVTIEEGEPF